MGWLPAVAAIATALAAGGRSLPSNPRRAIVLWRYSPVLVDVLNEHGVRNVKVYEYKTTVAGRKYTRTKIVIGDKRLSRWFARATWKKVRRIMWRYRDIVRRVLLSLLRVKPDMILKLVPWKWLREWYAIKPFDWWKYRKYSTLKIVKELKPNWRGWFFYLRRWRDRCFENILLC